MTAALTVSDLTHLALLLMAAGAITGLIAGLFGVGGGAILVPVLYESFRLVGVPEEVRMPLSVGTSLAIIIPTSIQSFRTHHAHGAVDGTVLKRWSVPVVIGVLSGSLVARYAPEQLFKIVFVGVAAVSAARLLFARDTWRFADDFPQGALVMRLYGFIIGILSTLMGIGGGALSNLLMTFYGRPIHQAIATSSGLGILISLPGALGYIYAGWPKAVEFPAIAALQWPYALGYISLIGAILVMPTSLLLAPLGARLAHSLKRRQLEVANGLFLLAVCARFLVSLIW